MNVNASPGPCAQASRGGGGGVSELLRASSGRSEEPWVRRAKRSGGQQLPRPRATLKKNWFLCTYVLIPSVQQLPAFRKIPLAQLFSTWIRRTFKDKYTESRFWSTSHMRATLTVGPHLCFLPHHTDLAHVATFLPAFFRFPAANLPLNTT